MSETIELGDISIILTRKDVKNVHLSVHPPKGHVTLVAPCNTRFEVARAYAITKLGWIREQKRKLLAQARETPRQYIERESHYIWGRRYLMTIKYADQKPAVTLSNKRIILTIRPGTSFEKRQALVLEWQRSLLHDTIPPLLEKWEKRLGVSLKHYFLQRMKTRWGSCNAAAKHIRINTELVKKPKDLLEYVIVHELAHLIAPTHSQQFVGILDKHYPHWREARSELNELPLAADAPRQDRS